MVSISKEQWKNNMCIIYAYKSDRKNAKIISDVTMRHLITHNENGAIDENMITNYFIDIIGQLVYDIKYHANTINITTYLSINHMTTYTDSNSELYSHNHVINFNNQRKKFYAIEELINYIYDMLLMVYPYTRLDIRDLYQHPSIKYFINLYYKKGV